jgi:cytochrome c
MEVKPVKNENHDEPDTPRPRWMAWAIGLFVLCIVLGMVNLAWMMLNGTLAPTDKVGSGQGNAAVTATSSTAVATVAAVVHPPAPPAASACMRCHGVDRKYVGPAFVSVAERYQGRSDAQAYLAGRILHGSVGEWGRVIMPRQVGVSEETAQQLAAWIVALAPAAPTDAPSAASAAVPATPAASSGTSAP